MVEQRQKFRKTKSTSQLARLPRRRLRKHTKSHTAANHDHHLQSLSNPVMSALASGRVVHRKSERLRTPRMLLDMVLVLHQSVDLLDLSSHIVATTSGYWARVATAESCESK